MTEVLHLPSPSSSPSPTSSPSSSSLSCKPSQSLASFVQYEEEIENGDFNEQGSSILSNVCDPEEEELEKERERNQQLSLLALLVTLFRKSWAVCKTDRRQLCAMEIGWPTNVRHVAHVTFDRFNGFLGLPVEFEPEVPRRAPSASTTVFGVSTESMQLAYDSRGNSVPTILLLMQRHLYAQGGLQAEGIFRINAENSQEEYVRDQLNRGVVPDGIDVHCLAGLIKAWFRELPVGVLDSLSPEQVIQSQTEDECTELVRHLPATEAALLDWAINLMADVVEQEDVNKMNARNIAMVFAPNMTQMADPLTALMYAVQVMNFLKTLILRTLRARKDSVGDPTPATPPEPFDENGHQSPSLSFFENSEKDIDSTVPMFIAEEPVIESSCNFGHSNFMPDGDVHHSAVAVEKTNVNVDQSYEMATQAEPFSETDAGEVKSLNAADHASVGKSKIGQSSDSNLRRVPRKLNRQQSVTASIEKTRGISNLSRIDSRTERIEAWR